MNTESEASKTSARRVSELGTLLFNSELCTFHMGRMVLRMDSTFVPKVSMQFHCDERLIPPFFCPKPSNPKEKA